MLRAVLATPSPINMVTVRALRAISYAFGPGIPLVRDKSCEEKNQCKQVSIIMLNEQWVREAGSNPCLLADKKKIPTMFGHPV